MTTKLNQAIEIYQEFVGQESSMSHREFRKLVSGAMKDRMGLKASGTVASYFADAANAVHQRQPKQYTYGKRERTSQVDRDAIAAESAIAPAFKAWGHNSVINDADPGSVPSFKRPSTKKWSDVAKLLHNDTKKVP